MQRNGLDKPGIGGSGVSLLQQHVARPDLVRGHAARFASESKPDNGKSKSAVGQRRGLTAGFKQEAAQLVKQPAVALSEVAHDLKLSEWVPAGDQKGRATFRGKGKPGLNAEQADSQRLRREAEPPFYG